MITVDSPELKQSLVSVCGAARLEIRLSEAPQLAALWREIQQAQVNRPKVPKPDLPEPEPPA